ncbi:hypothetical protein [Actinoplanes sp. NPDC049802]|uniref:hypothetical protein n=1 Tax=Actinoplanes sp. NPDC049802 TaxID=3154742 RepID=UPI0034105C89
MSEHLEQQLRDVFAQDADEAPILSPATVGQVAGRVRRRRHLSVAAGAAVLVVLVSGTALAGAATFGDPPKSRSETVTARYGELPDARGADCSAYRSAGDLATRDFAFDGTVEGIASPATSQPVPYTAVTFTVHEWFRGGSGNRATVTMMAPLGTGVYVSEAGPSYMVGTRLLVSGDSWVAATCGYTRYYDEATAAAWRAAVRDR